MLVELSDNILKEEQTVLDIIQEYLNKNRTFNKNEIIPFINAKIGKSHSNISYNGIYEILKSLVEKNIIVEGSKLIKYDVLSNINRKQIYKYIIKNPGCHFNKLVKTLNISIFSVEWHLNILIKFNLIRKEKIENFEAYFDSKMPFKNDEILMGVVYNPCTNEMFFAEKGKGSYLNNKKLQVSKKNKLKDCIVGFSLSSNITGGKKSLSVLNKTYGKFRALRNSGSATLNLCYVVDKKFDLYFSLNIKAWDIAAAKLIAEEAGCKVTNLNGKKWGIKDREIVAGNSILHKKFIKLLK